MKINIKELLSKYFGQIMNTKILIIIFIVGIGLLFLPVGSKDKPKEAATIKTENKEDIEEEIEAILSKIKGAGRVDVMVTLADEGTTYYAQNERAQNTDDEKTVEKNYVLSKSSNTEGPLVIKKTTPAVSGILVCAEGAGNPQVKSDIISATSALLGVKSHRIEVLERG